MRTLLLALIIGACTLAAGACSTGAEEGDAGAPHGLDAGHDAGHPKDAGHTEDAGTPDAGVDGGGDVIIEEDTGIDGGRLLATIHVDTSTATKVNGRLINGAGLEVENNAQGLGAEMLVDRGFEWDRPWLAQHNPPWETWYFFKDQTDEATVEWVTDRIYQGTHAFKLTMTWMQSGNAAGVAQGGLGVVKDRAYVFSFWVYHEGNPPQAIQAAMLDVPDPNDPSKNTVIVDPVSVVPDKTAYKWTNYTVELHPKASTKTAALAFLVAYPSTIWVDAFSLTPKDAAGGVWKELVDAFTAARIAAVRLGGISADGYDWGMGIGPRDRRGVYKSAFADTSLDPTHEVKFMPVYNDVGTDEFLDFCKAIGAEPLITVNFPLGSQAAANWVEYANGASPGLQKGIDNGWKPASYKSADKAPAGYFAWLREFNGVERGAHKDPWRVKYWEIGNELWDEALPEPGSLKGMQNLSNYAVQTRGFATAMKAVDPSILVGANSSPLPIPAPNDYRNGWDGKVLEVAGDVIDYLAPHFYAPGDFDYDTEAKAAPEATYYKIAGAAPFYAQAIGQVQKDIDDWKNGIGAGRNVKIAVTEYNVWHEVLKYQNKFDVNRLRSVIANASFRNVNARGPVWMGNFYSLVNHPFGMLDWDAGAKAAGTPLLGGNYVLQKFLQDHFAPKECAVDVQAPSYTATWGLAGLDPVDAPVIDASAALSDDGGTLILLVVNRAYGWWPDGVRTTTDLGGFAGTGAKAYILTGAGQDVYNDLGARGEIHLEEEDVPVSGAQFDYTFKQYSVTAIEVKK